MAFGGACRDPGQCGDLLRYLFDRITLARLVGEEQDDLPFVVTPWRTVGYARGVEIG
jgi:hypothetical protein